MLFISKIVLKIIWTAESSIASKRRDWNRSLVALNSPNSDESLFLRKAFIRFSSINFKQLYVSLNLFKAKENKMKALLRLDLIDLVPRLQQDLLEAAQEPLSDLDPQHMLR